eukprot:g4700.t1
MLKIAAESKGYFRDLYKDIEGQLIDSLHDKVVRRINARTVLTACICFEKRQKEKLSAQPDASDTDGAPAAPPGAGAEARGGAAATEPRKIHNVPTEIQRLIFQFMGGVPLPNLHARAASTWGVNRLLKDYSHVRRFEKLAQDAFGLKIEFPPATNSDDGVGFDTCALLYPIEIACGTGGRVGDPELSRPRWYQFTYAAKTGTITDGKGEYPSGDEHEVERKAVTSSRLPIRLEYITPERCSTGLQVRFMGRSDAGRKCAYPFEFAEIQEVKFPRTDDDQREAKCVIYFTRLDYANRDLHPHVAQPPPVELKKTTMHLSLHGKIGGSFVFHDDTKYTYEEFKDECERQRSSMDVQFVLEYAKVKFEAGSQSPDKFQEAVDYAKLIHIPVRLLDAPR